MTHQTQSALASLEEILREMESAGVAYSGGVDSTLVTVAAHRVLGDGALAVTAISPALAARELDEAASLTKTFGFNHQVSHTNELQREGGRYGLATACAAGALGGTLILENVETNGR